MQEGFSAGRQALDAKRPDLARAAFEPALEIVIGLVEETPGLSALRQTLAMAHWYMFLAVSELDEECRYLCGVLAALAPLEGAEGENDTTTGLRERARNELAKREIESDARTDAQVRAAAQVRADAQVRKRQRKSRSQAAPRRWRPGRCSCVCPRGRS